MGLDYEQERYVRLFVRDTTSWKMGPWQARAMLPLILRKLDRAGVLDISEDGVEGLAAMTDMPLEVTEVGLAWWIKRGALKMVRGNLVMPNFLIAQEATQKDAQRARESRARKRELALAAEAGLVTKRDDSDKKRDGDVTEVDEAVTGGHSVSLRTVPSRTVPSRTVPVEKAPPPPPDPVRKKRRGPIPEDWTPTKGTVDEYAANGIDALASLRRFKNHWLGNGESKVDWERTFQNWVDRDVARGEAKAMPDPGFVPPPAPDDAGPPDPESMAKLRQLRPKSADDLFATKKPRQA